MELELTLLENNVALEVTDAIKKSLSEKLVNKEITSMTPVITCIIIDVIKDV